MKLVASMIVKDELGRYLEPCVEHLLEFVDEIRVLDDSSTDGSLGWLASRWIKSRVFVAANTGPTFFHHEGHARERLLRYTLAADPTHVIAIDADEFIADGPLLRRTLERSGKPAFALCLSEVWGARPDELDVRYDGQWGPRRTPCVYAVPPEARRNQKWIIYPTALACGREPVAVRDLYHHGQAEQVDIDIFHFGWANPAERAERYARYVKHDGGRYHRSQHLDSIMWPDRRVTVQSQPWPTRLEPYRAAVLDRMAARAA